MHLSQLELMLVAGVAIPLVSFAILAFFGSRIGKPLAGWVATLAIASSCALATTVLLKWQGMTPDERTAAAVTLHHPVLWAELGTVKLWAGVNLDSLTVIMFFMVTFIATWIHVFSIGYMAGHSDQVDHQSKYHRFFCYLSLFCFSMLGLLIASSLLFLFIFWELVGLCSYLLIGFYFDRKYATNAAMKAFITNRVGDFGFIIGLGMVFLFLGDFTLAGAAEQLRRQHAEHGVLFSTTFMGVQLATWMGCLLFCGAMGKSAQFPLHVWLPDAMAGPTPVSALIHAATMVAAGVYLVARIFVLLTPGAQLFIATIGCITLTLTALIAIVQTDIKKVLAYSTLSQLGYMILGMGVGSWIGALFHLLTHAFFKALMFLGSGQVIEGCHHEQDMRKMGGLWRKMPVTCFTFLIGVLAIAGTGIPGSKIGLGGFFSKDEILAVAYHRTFGEGGHEAKSEHAAGGRLIATYADASATHGVTTDGGPAHDAAPAPSAHDSGSGGHKDAHGSGHAGSVAASPFAADTKLPWYLFCLPLTIAYITPFYMMRAWWMTFMGKPRDHHVHDHAHESPLMYIPLVVLAIGTIWSSYYLFRPMVASAHPNDFLVFSYDAEHVAEHGQAIGHEVHGKLATLVGFAFVVGFVLAIAIYARGLETAEKLRRVFRPLHTLLEHKFYIDELYGLVLIGGVAVLRNIAYAFDKFIVDGIVNLTATLTRWLALLSGNVMDAKGVDGLVNGVGYGAWELGGAVRSPQDGRIRSYILYVACGATAIVLLIVLTPWN